MILIKIRPQKINNLNLTYESVGYFFIIKLMNTNMGLFVKVFSFSV